MDELVKLVKFLKENKVEYYKKGDMELRFAYDAFDNSLGDLDNDINDDDDFLFSSGLRAVKRNPKTGVKDKEVAASEQE